MFVFVVPGAQLSPHHAAAGSDAAISPVVSLPVPALPEPQQPPRSAQTLLKWLKWLISIGTGLIWNIQNVQTILMGIHTRGLVAVTDIVDLNL